MSLKTLVIILAETRSSEITFENIKTNLIDTLSADLCVCIGVKADYDYNNPFYKLAKYKFTMIEPEEYSEVWDKVFNLVSSKFSYEILENVNTMYNKDAKYVGNFDNLDTVSLMIDKEGSDDEYIYHTNLFQKEEWKNKLYSISSSTNDTFVRENDIITFKKPLNWREFIKIPEQFMGGVGHAGSGGILIYYRWLLYQNLISNNIIENYDRFVITRSDFIYTLPHPSLDLMDGKHIWIPNEEHYGGYTDRHAILSKQNIESYLNILYKMITKSNRYFMKMRETDNWNLERLIKFHLREENKSIKEFPYIMYSVRGLNGTTRWQWGEYSEEHGYYIKYNTEYEKATYYKKMYLSRETLTFLDFYKEQINALNDI